MTSTSRTLFWLRIVGIVLAVTASIVTVENLVVRAYFPHLPRLAADFSATYLDRELRSMSASPPGTVFLGDSVLWGFALEPQQTAVALLHAKGCDCRNLSFKASSPANYYALVRLMQEYHVRPRLVVLEVDQRVLQAANDAYAKLHPAVAHLAGPLLTPGERKMLGIVDDRAARTKLDRLASSLSLVYAMRTDIEETFYPTPEATPMQHPTADMFYAEYDLTPLTDRNVGVYFLERTAETLRAEHIPTLAFMTPTNHELLHEYIDGPEYHANVLYLRRVLEQRGVRVLDIDGAFLGADFYDSAHLKASAQLRLAELLEPVMERSGYKGTFR